MNYIRVFVLFVNAINIETSSQLLIMISFACCWNVPSQLWSSMILGLFLWSCCKTTYSTPRNNNSEAWDSTWVHVTTTVCRIRQTSHLSLWRNWRRHVWQLKTLKMSMTLAVMKRLKWKVLIEVSHYPKGKLVFPQPFCLAHGPGLEELFASTIAYCTGATLSLQDPSWFFGIQLYDCEAKFLILVT